MTVLTATGTISSDEIKNLKNSPVQLIEAPDEGEYLIPINFFLECQNGEALYSGGSSLSIQYSSGLCIGSIIASFLSQSKKQVFFTNATFMPYSPVDSTQVESSSIDLSVISDDFTDGDGEIKWSITYQVVTTS